MRTIFVAAAVTAVAMVVPATAVAHESNRVLVQQDLAHFAATLPLPSTAVRVTSEPAGDGGTLGVAPLSAFPGSGDPNLISAGGWWIVSNTTPEVLLGSIAGQTAGAVGSTAPGLDGSYTGVFEVPARRGSESQRWVALAAITLPDGQVGLRADVAAIWVATQPLSEHVPTTADRLTVTVTTDDAPWPRTLRITDRRTIRRLARLIDHSIVIQPAPQTCVPTSTEIRMGFGVSGQPGAAAVATIGAEGCSEMTLTVHGKRQPYALFPTAALRNEFSTGLGIQPVTTRAAAVHDSASNQAAATADAAKLLAALELPADAIRSVAEPADDGGVLGSPGSTLATPNLVDDVGWWTLPGESPSTLIAGLEDHLPTGATVDSHGTGGGPGIDDWEMVTIAWPPVAGVLSTRWLVVSAVQADGGTTAVRADGESVWVTTHPLSERIPSGAGRVMATVASVVPRVSRTARVVTNTRQIARATALLDALPVFPPGTYSCPPTVGTTRLAFYRAASATPLAVATIDTDGCNTVRLTIGGRRQAVALTTTGYVGRQLLALIRRDF